ncbi:19033_t:CDS:2, partial [Racocetra persica]
TLPKKITGSFEFGEFRETEKKYTKKRKLNINELKAEEHQIYKRKNKKKKIRDFGGQSLFIFSDLAVQENLDLFKLYLKMNYMKKLKSKSLIQIDYDDQEVVFIDEFYMKLDWTDIVNYPNDTSEWIEIKAKGFVLFLAKYIFLTARKPPEDAFNFGQCEEDTNQRGFLIILF